MNNLIQSISLIEDFVKSGASLTSCNINEMKKIKRDFEVLLKNSVQLISICYTRLDVFGRSQLNRYMRDFNNKALMLHIILKLCLESVDNALKSKFETLNLSSIELNENVALHL
ncbi:hypothetical protein DRF75_04020 [Ehrlichia minasensis]|uniref:Uncharacterized protein n=1 Tax=Ehrlichia minasensis TaxID=1242993 RepID=A0A4Q6I5A2_9RICK|nr:hypothetical protein [Ehrlichia minasensis]RZB12460.1 hypothetical protein DRF75_04020 [Ehrlichia minasensis]